MSNETEKANLPATTNDADLAALAGAARNLVTDETSLRFIKGRWRTLADKNDPQVVGATESFVFDMLSYANGWIHWMDRRPVHKYILRPIDGWILPTRDRLPDRDKSQWPLDKDGKRSDPWQETHKITVKNTTTGELFCWTTTSWYGRKALGRLLDAYVREAKKHPGLMPTATLSSKDEPHPDYGDIPTPVLTVVDWQAFGDGAAPPGQRELAQKVALGGKLPPTSRITTGVIDAEFDEADEITEEEIGFGEDPKVQKESDLDENVPF